MTPRRLLWMVLSVCFCALPVRADLVECENGDRYHGNLLLVDADTVKITNEITGLLSIPRSRVTRITFRENASPSTVFVAPSTNSPTLDSATIGKIQQEWLGSAGPEANQMFQEMVQGLMSGRLTSNDIRSKARSALGDLRQMQQELDDEDANALLETYATILENLLQSAPANTRTNTATPK